MCFFLCYPVMFVFLLFTGILTDKKPTGQKFFVCFGAVRVDTGFHPLSVNTFFKSSFRSAPNEGRAREPMSCCETRGVAAIRPTAAADCCLR